MYWVLLGPGLRNNVHVHVHVHVVHGVYDWVHGVVHAVLRGTVHYYMMHCSRSSRYQRTVRACAVVGGHRKGALGVARCGVTHTGGRAAKRAILLREGEAGVGL